jgi:putative endonuclease
MSWRETWSFAHVAHPDQRIVYVLRSITNPSRHYVGITTDLVSRLNWHNHGPSGATVHHRPWEVVVSMHFPDEQAARCFERYLKSASGRAFAKRHFGMPPGTPVTRDAGANDRHREP